MSAPGTETTKGETTAVAPKAAPAKLQMTKVKAALHLIIQPTKLFDETDPDRVVILSNNNEMTVHVMDPFDNVSVVTASASKPSDKIPGFFRACLFPALRVVREFNTSMDAGVMRIGSAKETDQLYKDMAFALLNKVEAVMPSVSNLFQKTVMVNKVEDGDSSFTWTIDIYAYYRYKGAVVEDVVPHVNTILNAVHGVDSKGKELKGGPLTDTGLTLSVAVDPAEGYMLAFPEVDMAEFKFSTTMGDSDFCPATKTGKISLFGAKNDQPSPLMLFSKVVKV